MLFIRQLKANAALQAALLEVFALMVEESGFDASDGLAVHLIVDHKLETIDGSVTLVQGPMALMEQSL